MRRTHEMSVKHQAELRSISRGTVHYQSRPIGEEDLAIMRCIDKLHLESPFARARMLRGLPIERANHVWAMQCAMQARSATTDKKGGANVSRPSRPALDRPPQIMNTDQGSRFMSSDFTGQLNKHGIAISMDGRGCWRDAHRHRRLYNAHGGRTPDMVNFATLSRLGATA